jgi:hypothetical protein
MEIILTLSDGGKMKTFNGLQFDNFTKDDVGLLTPIMKLAFDDDAKRHLNENSGGPDGYDNGGFLTKWALHNASNKQNATYCILW